MYCAKNYMEVLVEQYLDETLQKRGDVYAAIRGDSALRAQVMAIALNNIPPFYVTGKTGEVYGFSSNAVPQTKANIMVEIAKAIEVIAAAGYN